MGLFGPRRESKREGRQIPPARLREITSWLRHPVSAGEAEVLIARGEPGGEGARLLRAWLDGHLLGGDELWWYDTGGDSWENLAGENGFAVVRGGQVVAFYMWLMN